MDEYTLYYSIRYTREAIKKVRRAVSWLEGVQPYEHSLKHIENNLENFLDKLIHEALDELIRG